jgi:O-antigen/teichoic acid export membrane protein
MRLSHIGWNFAGLSLPLVVAAVTVPHLLNTLGQERFGLLTLAWGLIGYAGALDLGIGRAATQYIAKLKVGSGSHREQIPIVLATAIRITLLAGGVGALIITISVFAGVESFIKVNEVTPREIRISIFFLALALPMQAISATYRGVNEAYLNFKGISVIRVLLGMANFGLPFLVAFYSKKVHLIILSLVVSRALALCAYKVLAEACVPRMPRGSRSPFSLEIGKELFRFGGWFTLSGLLNPIVATADRFVISSLVSAAAVSLYVIPYEMVVQSLILVGAVTTVTFPYFSQLSVSEPVRLRQVFNKVMGASLFAMLPVVLIFAFFGETILSLWLGTQASATSFSVIRVLSVGLLPYTVGTLCISLLHAYGKTEITAKLNLIEFPIFIGLIYFFVSSYGVVGAAYAWALRVTLDAVILFLLAYWRK